MAWTALLSTALRAGQAGLAAQATAGPSTGTANGMAGFFQNATGALNKFTQGAGQSGSALNQVYQTAKNFAPTWAKLGMEIAELPGKIAEWGRSLVESQRHLAQYNGAIAGSLAQLDADRIDRDIRTGEATSGSFEELAESQSKLEEAMLPFQQAWTNVSNKFQSFISDITSSLLKGFSDLPLVKELLEWLGVEKDKKHEDPRLNQLFHEARDRFHEQNKPIPPLK